MGVAAALGAACGLFAMDGIETPAIARALASLGPHPTVASLSESLAFGHPMVRRIGGVWAQSVPSLWITAAARRRIDENPGDPALAERMRVYIDADRDRLGVERPRDRGGAGRLSPLCFRDRYRLSRRTVGPRRPLGAAPHAPRPGGWQAVTP